MATSDKPKLVYYDGPGLGEITRLIFVYTGNEFEDVRFTREEWSKYQAESPLGMVPFYEEGGVKLGGSLAIARYVAEKYGLGGSNPLENAILESYGDAIKDIKSKMYPIKFGPEENREELKADFLKNAPGKAAFLEKQIKGKDSFIDGKITWPDFMMYNLVVAVTIAGFEEVIKDCPKAKAIHAKYAENEKFKAYYAKHPLPKP